MTHPDLKYPAPRIVSLALFAAFTLTACGGDDTTIAATTPVTPTPVSSAPGAPIMGAVTAGNASASVAFTAPTFTGSTAITSYTATCTAGTSSGNASAATSPITVTGLTNGTSYGCSVTATNSVGTSTASSVIAVTPVSATTQTPTPTGTTLGTLCNYSYSALNSSASINMTSTSAWTCSTTSRMLTGNGIPDHAVGTFPNAGNPNTISAQTISATYTLTPTQTTTATTLGGPRGAVGYVLNGVKIDPSTAGSCDNSGATCSAAGNVGPWSIEALGQSSFNFGTDTNNAHVQPGGEYHYHGMPEGFVTKLGGGSTKMTLIAWAADGYPIYARYGYTTATNASTALKIMKGSYQFKATPDTNRPATTLFPMGTFQQDYQYVVGSGDLDECNGRTGVTPEFPGGIYHYYATDSYPFLQRCVKGAVTTTGGPPPG
jgi:YHYH protein/Fibronectin type III domain